MPFPRCAELARRLQRPDSGVGLKTRLVLTRGSFAGDTWRHAGFISLVRLAPKACFFRCRLPR